MTKAATRWLVAGLVAMLAAWALAPAAVPVFDGIGQPDEPYRYVDPPPTAKTTRSPTVAKRVVAVRNGANLGQYVNSEEQGPQISVYVAPGGLGVPSGATSVTVTATPLAPKDPLPTDGTILTNVYRITAEADGQDVPVTGTGAQAPAVSMRAPTAKQPGPVFERRTADGWERLPTFRSGSDIYQTSEVTKFGEFALVEVNDSGGGSGVNVTLLVAGLGVLLVAGVVFVIRLRRTGGNGEATEPASD